MGDKKHKKIDWAQIRAEYITQPDTSYRSLAAKYGVTHTVVARMGKQGGWAAEKLQNVSKMSASVLAAAEAAEQDKRQSIYDVSNKVLAKLSKAAELCPEEDVKGLKTIVSAIKDIQDIQGVMSPAAARETEAKIDLMIAQAQNIRAKVDEGSKEPITIRIEGDAQNYSS